MRALEFIITGHVICKLRYNQIYQLKTTNGRVPNKPQIEENFHFKMIWLYVLVSEPDAMLSKRKSSLFNILQLKLCNQYSQIILSRP